MEKEVNRWVAGYSGWRKLIGSCKKIQLYFSREMFYFSISEAGVAGTHKGGQTPQEHDS